MRKMKVLGMGNEDNFNYLIIKKSEGFFEWFNELLVEAFGGAENDVMYCESRDKDGKIINEKRDVNDETDTHEYYPTNDGIRVDVFYGKEKVFLTFNCSLDKRGKFMKKLEEISDFEE